MSYILDALRRAEAERERERSQVPGLHAQPLVQPAAQRTPASRRWQAPLLALVILALLAGLAVVLAGGRWWGADPPSAPPAPPATATAPQAAPQTVLPSVPAQPPASAAVAPVKPVLNSPALPTAAESARLAPAAPPLAPTAAMPARATPLPTSPVPSRSAEDRIPRLAELPESTRQALPKLTISGSIYSEDASSRFVMINGEVAREGAVLAPDLVLEQIRPRELVMRFRGQRYLQPV